MSALLTTATRISLLRDMDLSSQRLQRGGSMSVVNGGVVMKYPRTLVL